ncbi:MAG: heme-binding protein [SAR202 cluster bacterium]|nr:heme-binding protein [SAR202 cluster bacterium]MQG35286.1 heme-binding protein [SAR202 cluster bacterium]MQG86810.1 heme-binding protein [SAR202 cluster bacterium]|tara:strand:- start:12245 stop:12661 length:417 start_codon:yes stop_codon:yes gene_type:complete
MYMKEVLSLEQVRRSMNAMLEAALKEPDRPIAIAILDENTNLLNYARMDGCRLNPQGVAIRKAYTAVMFGQNSSDFAQRLKNENRQVTDFGNPSLVAVKGGVVVISSNGDILGGIGVSGLTAEEDEEIALIGLNALEI